LRRLQTPKDTLCQVCVSFEVAELGRMLEAQGKQLARAYEVLTSLGFDVTELAEAANAQLPVVSPASDQRPISF
jgi:hypothetical protein